MDRVNAASSRGLLIILVYGVYKCTTKRKRHATKIYVVYIFARSKHKYKHIFLIYVLSFVLFYTLLQEEGSIKTSQHHKSFESSNMF